MIVLGGAAGAGLLLLTPSRAFEVVVPGLVSAAAVVLLAAPRLRRAAQLHALSGRTLGAGLFATAVYAGYFGAAAGVVMLALLLVGLPVTVLEGNALKNVLLGLANAVAAAGFAVAGPVHWPAVPPMALGLLVGARLGPVVARRLPETALRIGIGIAGLGLAVVLAAQAA